MKVFTVGNGTNNITVHGTIQDAEGVPNADRFGSEAGLEKLARDWPMAKLVEIWNSLPGVTPVSKFKDRSTAASRIWRQIQTLEPAPATEASPEVADEQSPAEREQQAEAGSPETASASEAPVPEVTSPVGTAAELPGGEQQPDEQPSATDTDVAPPGAHVAPEEGATDHNATPAEEAPVAPSPIDEAECDRLRKIAAAAQGEYWDALRDLEEAIGFEIDDPGDLDETTPEELITQHAAKRKPRAATKGVTRENSKTIQVIAMLKRPEGTTLEEIMTAMQWQKHTTRAMLSAGGSLAKKHGLTITTEKVGQIRRYYIKG